MIVTWVHVALLFLLLFQAAMVTLAVVTWRESRRLSNLQESYVEAVTCGNYPAADLYAGAWLTAASLRRRCPLRLRREPGPERQPTQ